MAITSTRTQRARRGGLTLAAAIALAALAGACSSGSEPIVQTLPPGTSGGSTTVTTSHGSGTIDQEPEGTATIRSFEIRNQISCTGDIDITTAADYETEGGASVSFLVDGEQIRGTAPLSGSLDIPLACDGRSHTVVLVVVDPAGTATVDSRVVLTSTTPLGN
jgi:hypothetical protein